MENAQDSHNYPAEWANVSVIRAVINIERFQPAQLDPFIRFFNNWAEPLV